MSKYKEPWFVERTRDYARVWDVFLAASNYQDWSVYIESGDDDGAEAAYELYLAYKKRVMAGLLVHYGPSLPKEMIEARAVGLIDGFLASWEEGEPYDVSPV